MIELSNYLEKSKVYKGFHYSVLKPEMIAYLHSTTIKMLKVIIPIFDCNNITYMICGGTLLGAVMTSRFIPWDDDVDICILEDDYDRAIECLIQNVPEWMFVQCSSTETKYYHGWVKVRDKRSHVYPDVASYSENGVWIDLYKLTLAKKREVPYLITKEHLDYLNRRFSVGDISKSERDKRILDNNLLERLDNDRITANSSGDTDQTYIIWSASKILVDPDWCLPRTKYKFEGITLYGFNNATQYLSRHYGDDFANLPPEELRRVGINRIEFEEKADE